MTFIVFFLFTRELKLIQGGRGRFVLLIYSPDTSCPLVAYCRGYLTNEGR